MKCLSTKIALFFLAFVFCFCSSRAQQQFRWVQGGGTNENFSADPIREWEQTEYMCTDANGNIYALNQVGTNAIYADTFVLLSGAYGSYQNILITSYNCNGQMRWAKLIGSNGANSACYGIAADSSGHIYVAGSFQSLGETLYIGYDTTITGLGYESTGLVQLDTTGHFNWIQYIGDNTMASLVGVGTAVLTIGGSNNPHLLTYLKDGVHVTPTVTSVYGTYDLVYNSSGTLLSSARLDLDSEWYLNGAVIDPATNKLYASGQINQSIYGGFLTDTFFAAAFDASRILLWQYFCGHGDDDATTGVVLGQDKNLYFSGASQGPPWFSFHGDSVEGSGDMAIVMKTDTDANVKWIKHYNSTLSVNSFNAITLLPNCKVAAAGTFAGAVTDGTVTLSTPPGEGYSPYFVIVDSGEHVLTLQQIHGDGFYNIGTTITSDNVGNVYVGGQVVDSIWAGTPPIPAYHTVGGNSDFFVMKYGVDCSCISGPTAAYTDTGTHHTIGVTYTGTTTGLDSVVWNFGDGTTGTGTTALHTYTATGTYNVCVTTYTDCGIDEHCSSFVVDSVSHVLVSSVTSANISVYPNPARDELNVTGLVGSTDYRLLNVTGNCVGQGVLQAGSGSISMVGIVAGVYVLELTGMDGGRDIVRVVKE